MIDRQVNRVVHRGLQSRIQILQGIDKIAHASREILLKEGILLKRHDKGFVVGVALFNKGKSRAVNLVFLVSHAPAVIDNHTDAQRNVLMLEKGNVLDFIVFQNLEILLSESFNGIPGLVQSADMNFDEVHIDSNPERTVSGSLSP